MHGHLVCEANEKNKIKTYEQNYKTTEYLRMKGVLDSIELWVLRRADYMRVRNILGESHVHSYFWNAVSTFYWVSYGWARSLLSLAFTARCNPKHPSYVSTGLFSNSISQVCCGEQTIWDVQSYWQVKKVFIPCMMQC